MKFTTKQALMILITAGGLFMAGFLVSHDITYDQAQQECQTRIESLKKEIPIYRYKELSAGTYAVLDIVDPYRKVVLVTNLEMIDPVPPFLVSGIQVDLQKGQKFTIGPLPYPSH